MTAWTVVAGSATSWLLILVLGTGLGYGMVLSWSRWGALLPVPAPASAVLGRVLGPTGGTARPAPPLQETATQTTAPPAGAEPEPVPEAPPPRRLVAEVTEPLAASAEASAEAEDEPPLSDPGEAMPASPRPAREPTEEMDANPHSVRPVRVLPRTEALTELSTIIGLEYDDAAALLDHGLWGFENFDEWTRSMRGRERPEDVSEAAWEKVLQVDWRVLAPTVDAHREKHAAMQRLEELWGVGPDEAEALFNAGYRDLPSIRKVSTEALAKVPGIGAARAFQIRASAHGLAPAP